MDPKGRNHNVKIDLVGKPDSVFTSRIALYQMRAGKPVKQLAVLEKDAIAIDAAWAKTAKTVALGPDVENPAMLEAEQLFSIRIEDVLKANVFEIPKDYWDRWVFRRACVSGTVKRCFPFMRPIEAVAHLDPSLLHMAALEKERGGCSGCGSTEKSRGWSPLSGGPVLGFNLPIIPRICKPVCHGIVEIYEVCCTTVRPPDPCDLFPFLPGCHPPTICERFPEICRPFDLCRRFPDICHPLYEVGPFDPIGPIAEIDINKYPIDPVEARNIKYALATLDPVVAARKRLPERVIRDLKVMMSMKAAEARDYLADRPYLHPLFIRCTTKKVAETTLRPDGSFSSCYLTSKKACVTNYAFVVKQWQNGSMVEVYNGLESHEYFTADETKLLYANAAAYACQPDPGPEHEKPYVMLQKIGSTDSLKLKSPVQLADEGIDDVLAVNAGLVDMSYATDCPWSKTLAFQLKFSDEMYTAINARFYRISVAPCDARGNATGDFVPLTASITWRKLVYTAGHFDLEYVPLGPQTKDNQYGLYSIPNPSDDWLDSCHGYWNTTTQPGGRYLTRIEIFKEDSAHVTQIKPGDAGADFVFLHWSGDDTPADVTQKSLVHVFWTDHVHCFAGIEDLRHVPGLPSSEDCQFVTGQAGDTIAVGYRAFHRHGPAAGTFMQRYVLQWQRGFNGTLQLPPWDSGTTNQPATLDAGPPAVSPTRTLAEMFAGDTSPSPHKKCTFMARLYVYAKHTDGSSRINAYDSADYASFALEIAPGGGPTP